MCDMKKYFIPYEGTPFYPNMNCSVHSRNFRFEKAREQSNLKTITVQEIIEYINNFLGLLNKKDVKAFKISPKDVDYQKIKDENRLNDIKDIVWLKFTNDGYLGVVAASNDINFDIPKSKNQYDEKIKVYDTWSGKEKVTWKYNTSGIIVHKVNKSWNKDFVVIFPLKNISNKSERSNLEMAIGNYLIDKGVPILDFYSHNY